jgi:hypothetical protein
VHALVVPPVQGGVHALVAMHVLVELLTWEEARLIAEEAQLTVQEAQLTVQEVVVLE